MRNRLKYFIFNKTKDYQSGCLENLIWDQDGIRVSQTDGNSRGTFISRILDSKEKDMEWYRMVFEVSCDSGNPYRITIFAANRITIYEGQKVVDFNLLIQDPELTFDEKMLRMKPYIQKQETAGCDILLSGVTGRYLWIAAELFGQNGKELCLKHMQFYFPKQTWLGYLPEIYQTSDNGNFLERYLAIFQTLHESMNQRIREVPAMIDVDLAEKEYLIWLSKWLDISGNYMWPEKQLRKLLKNGLQLYKKRGTRAGILEFLRLYTGGEAYLVENHQMEPYMADPGQKEILGRLYGVSSYTFCVVLKKEYVPTQKDYKSLVRAIDEIKPAQMEADLVVLEPYMFLGSHTYMGINSIFGEYRELALDGLSMIPFSAIHSKQDKEIH